MMFPWRDFGRSEARSFVKPFHVYHRLAKIRSGVLEFDAEDQEYEIEYEEDDVLDYEDEMDTEAESDAPAATAGVEAQA